ncbi:MAG: hypothetical protein FWH24_04780 [Oscillospiraceae bacterium]|nr:hypothetical protein [Oscillospiraceae bacterium]
MFATSADKKNPDPESKNNVGSDIPGEKDNHVFGFETFDPDTPPKVKDLPRDGKALKSVYFFKVAAGFEPEENDSGVTTAVTISPASKFAKLTVSSQTKPAKIKVDYKKERVALKAGISYIYGAMTESIIMEKADVKRGLPFRDDAAAVQLLDNSGGSSTLTYWTAANGKKPRSKEQIVTVYNYSSWNDNAAIAAGYNKTKYTYKLPKGYEVRPVGSEGKWGTSVRRVTSTTEFEVRRKGNAKFDAKSSTWLKAGTRTASEFKILEITVGEYTVKDRKNQEIQKTGITKVEVK